MSNQKINIIQKVDLTDFDPGKPLFVNGNGGNGRIIKYRSVLTGGISGIGAKLLSTTSGSLISRWGWTNTDIRGLYIEAFQSFSSHKNGSFEGECERQYI